MILLNTQSRILLVPWQCVKASRHGLDDNTLYLFNFITV